MLSVKKAQRKYGRLIEHGLTPGQIAEQYAGETNLVGIALRNVTRTDVEVAPHGATETERVAAPRHRFND